ncbi:MAG: hypothetical protein FWF15_04180 [Oscillospiraceae bacterium]|nr:hypothetical protein [Oscillospiraceae bacterium]
MNDNYQKWIWVELITFDNTQADYGVQNYLDRCKFIPDGASLLLTWAEFVLGYKGLDHEYELHPNEQSYGGHLSSPERNRQDWTNFQLKGLIDEFHKHDIKVYLSYFNMAGEYMKDKMYLCETSAFNQRAGSFNVLKNLADGTPFEDVLQTATIKVLNDYNFDGVQIADGISSYRMALQYGDYSDEMVNQFTEYSKIVLPETENRAAYIWSELRQEWIDFHTWRWGIFYNKYAKRSKDAGKEAVFNSAWTRDPFEAIYRYGVDYRAVAAAGIDGCMVEDVSAGLAILSEQDNGYLMTDKMRRRIHYEYLTTLMMNRAAMPNLRITPLAGIHDSHEQWGVLEHMPTSMVRNVICNLNTLFFDDGKYKSITDGPFFCLADSLYESDWNFIRNCWNIGMIPENSKPCGVTVIWSDKRLDNEIAEFIKNRRTPTYRIVADLMFAGAPVFSIARIENIEHLNGPLLVTNYDLLPEDEYNSLKQYKNGEVFFVGEYKMDYDFDPKYSMEKCHMLWTHPLEYKPVPEDYYRKFADEINQKCGFPEIIKYRESCEIIATKTDDKHYRVILANDDYYYNHPMVDMKIEIESVKCLTRYEGYPLSPVGTTFQCRVAGRGADVFDVVLK